MYFFKFNNLLHFINENDFEVSVKKTNNGLLFKNYLTNERFLESATFTTSEGNSFNASFLTVQKTDLGYILSLDEKREGFFEMLDTDNNTYFYSTYDHKLITV